MRIAHFISSLGYFGAENIVLTLARHFNAQGDTSFVGAIGDTRQPPIEIISRAKELGVPTFIIEGKGRFDAGTVFRLRQFLRQNQIDLLHTHNYKSDAIGLLAVRSAGIPLVATAHGYTDMNRKVGVYERLDRFLLRWFFDRVVVVTDKILRDFPSQKRIVIPNGLDTETFARNERQREETRRRYGLAAEDQVIATVGRLSVEKNQVLFVKAAARLRKEFPEAKFLIVGAGPEEQNLRRLIAERRMQDRVILTGLIKDMPAVYSAVDIFVLSSVTEGIPLTILEAMAAGIPVVATRVGGVPDILEDNITGLLVESGDASGLAAKLALLLRDAELGKRLGGSGLAFVKARFAQEKMVEGYRRVYETLTHKG